MRNFILTLITSILFIITNYNSGFSQFQDKATALWVDNAGNVYVTGTSLDWENIVTPGKDIVTIKYNSAGTVQWCARFNGPASKRDGSRDMAVDDNGNVYVVGYSEATDTDLDYVAIKYNSAGEQQWVAYYNGPGNGEDYATAVGIDGSGNVYVTGYVYIEGQNYEFPFSGRNDDYVTIKYNSSGDEQWALQYDGPANGQDNAVDIAVDEAGNAYVTGVSEGTVTGGDYTTVKYNSNGQQQWDARYTGFENSRYHDYPSEITIDEAGNVYMTGFTDPTDYGTVKYNSTGQQQWVARYNSPEDGFDYAYAIAVDGSGNVYVTGSSGLTHHENYATIKYNSSGQQQWSRSYNGSLDASDHARDIAVDMYGNVYVTGSSQGGSNYCTDYVTIKYSTSGDEQWVKRYDGDLNAYDYAVALAVDGPDHVYVTGRSQVTNIYEDIVTIKYTQAMGTQLYDLIFDGLSCIDFNFTVIDSFLSPSSTPFGLAWDGNYLWHSDRSSNLIYQLNPTDGSVIYSFTPPISDPAGLTWDGSNLWCSDWSGGIIYKLNTAAGSIISSFASPESNPFGLAWDGTNLWCAETFACRIYKLNPADGSVIDYFEFPFWIHGLTFDGKSFWLGGKETVVNGKSMIYNVSLSGDILASYEPPGPVPEGLTWDNKYLWSCDCSSDRIYKINVGSDTPIEDTNGDRKKLPEEFKIFQNYPNPFNSGTRIEYHLPCNAVVNLTIYDLLGREVRRLVTETESAGLHYMQWDGLDNSGRSVVSGMYFYRIEVKENQLRQRSYVDMKKMLLIK